MIVFVVTVAMKRDFSGAAGCRGGSDDADSGHDVCLWGGWNN